MRTTKNPRIWCAAAVTWGVAAVLGMAGAAYLPGMFPETGAAAAPAPAASTAPVVPGAPATPDKQPGARQRAADAAVAYAEKHGWRTGIAVIDLSTGQATVAGDDRGFFRSESTVKLFMATRLYVEGRITPANEAAVRRLLSVSDDAAANALYAQVGGDGLQEWIATRYGIRGLGAAPVAGSGQWGSTLVSPAGMVTFLARVQQDKGVGTWLISALSDMKPTAADGTGQIFGLRAADPGAVVKQGWGSEDGDPTTVIGTPTVGYVDNGRYAVAIYTTRLPESPKALAQEVVTTQAKILLPGGRMPRL